MTPRELCAALGRPLPAEVDTPDLDLPTRLDLDGGLARVHHMHVRCVTGQLDVTAVGDAIRTYVPAISRATFAIRMDWDERVGALLRQHAPMRWECRLSAAHAVLLTVRPEAWEIVERPGHGSVVDITGSVIASSVIASDMSAPFPPPRQPREPRKSPEARPRRMLVLP